MPLTATSITLFSHTAHAFTLRMEGGWFLQNVSARPHDVTLHSDSTLQRRRQGNPKS